MNYFYVKQFFFSLIALNLASCTTFIPSEISDLFKKNDNRAALILIPVNVLVLKANGNSELNATISKKTMSQVLVEVNAIWEQANIAFVLDNIESLKAKKVDEYLSLRAHYDNRRDKEKLSLLVKENCETPHYRQDQLNLCIVGRLFNNAGGIFINLTRPITIWPLESKYRQPLNAASLAHEFGHFLDLPHNSLSAQHLMQGRGTTVVNAKYIQFLLTKNEIRIARNTAKKYNINKEFL